MAQKRTAKKTGGRSKSFVTKTITPGSGGTRISEEKYAAVREAILAAVPRGGKGIELRALGREVGRRVPKELLQKKGSAMWLTMAVKLDLEAHGVIERVPGVVPQHLRRAR